MENFYYLHFASDKEYERFGIAKSMQNIDVQIIPENGKKVINWELLILVLRDGEFADYLANDLGGRLCSEKLKSIIDNTLSNKDVIQWLPTIVKDENRNNRKYYFLHFPKNIKVLSKKKSIFYPKKMVIKPVLSKKKVKGLNVFGIPKVGGSRTFVSELLKRRITYKKCTGIDFTKVQVV